MAQGYGLFSCGYLKCYTKRGTSFPRTAERGINND